MAVSLSELGVFSVPVNALMPIKGTPFENMKQLSSEEILRTIAIFRFILPEQYIRFAAGRGILENNGRSAFLGGANAVITGDMLTTTGSSIASDISMFREIGFNIPEAKKDE